MNISFNAIKAIGSRVLFKTKQMSPELTLGAGIICGIGAIITACMATRKLDDVLDTAECALTDIESGMSEAESTEEFKAYKKAALEVKKDTVLELGKLYGPSALLGMASIGLILTSHGILKNRYLSTAAAYKALNDAYKRYRRYVAEDLGYGDGEKAIAARAKAKDDISVMDENGEVAQKKGKNLVMDDTRSPYEFDFNRFTSCMWDPDPLQIEMMLKREQNYFNDILQVRKYVFLNEVLVRLGLKPTSMGQNLGWAIGRGDNYIDFGYLEGFKRDMDVDIDLCRKNIRLNFNCDGDIVADIDKFERNRESITDTFNRSLWKRTHNE